MTSVCGSWLQRCQVNSGFEVIVGGGLGRTPMIGKVIREFLPLAKTCCSYVEAIVSGL